MAGYRPGYSFYSFHITIELRHETGKFASRDDIADVLREQLEQAAYEGVSGVGADGDSEYTVDDVHIEGP